MRGRIIPRKSYKLSEAVKIDERGGLMEFLSARSLRCGLNDYPKRGTLIRDQLETWRDHFEFKGTPYVITNVKLGHQLYGISLYKERRVEDV